MLVVIIILFGKISIELELCRPRSRRTWQDNLKIGLKNVNEPYHEFDRVAQVNWGILVNLQILYTVKLINNMGLYKALQAQTIQLYYVKFEVYKPTALRKHSSKQIAFKEVVFFLMNL